MNKRAEFLQVIDSKKLHVIVSTETWLSQSITNNEIIPDNMNYTIYRKDREDGHGGVMITVSKCIPSIHLPNLHTSLKFYRLNSVLQLAKTSMLEPFIDHVYQT